MLDRTPTQTVGSVLRARVLITRATLWDAVWRPAEELCECRARDGRSESLRNSSSIAGLLVIPVAICRGDLQHQHVGAESPIVRDRGLLQEAVFAWLGNPYIVEPQMRVAGAGYLKAHWPELPGLAEQLVHADLVKDAVRLLFAGVHWVAFDSARSHPVSGAYCDASTKLLLRLVTDVEPVFKGIRGRTSTDLLRVGAALFRFYDSMAKVAGSSEPTRYLRARVWQTAFGPSVHETIEHADALRRSPVLILGERGTGKERVAELLQVAVLGPDNGGPAPRQAVNAATIRENLAVSELFGHVRGAFTGASDTREGRIVSANGGSLFLDEVADLEPIVQPMLLRTLQEGKVSPTGTGRETPVSLRFISATNKPIERMAAEGNFRPDLLDRLAKVIIRLPTLRERRGDIIEIGRAIISRFYAKQGKIDTDPLAFLSWTDATRRRAQVAAWLEGHAPHRNWPGNIRELEAAVEGHLMGFGDDPGAEGAAVSPDVPPRILNSEATEAEVLKWYLARVLEKTDGNAQRAAEILKVDRGTLSRRKKKKRNEGGP